mgnify:CR=1 FL=1
MKLHLYEKVIAEDPVVLKYTSTGLNKEAVVLALATYGDIQTKASLSLSLSLWIYISIDVEIQFFTNNGPDLKLFWIGHRFCIFI